VDLSTKVRSRRASVPRAIVVGLALSVVAAACGSSASPTSAPASGAPAATSAPAATTSGGEVSLRFLFPEYSAKTVELMTEVVNDFNAANTGKISVALETSPWDKMHDKLAVSMGSGEAPCVFGYATRWISEFAGLGQLATLDDMLQGDFKAGFIPKLLDAGILDGKTYGIPVAASARLLFYNKDLFEKAGVQPPTNWDELKNAAIKTANPPSNYGLGVPASGIEVDTFFTYFLWNNGGDILDANGKSMLSQPKSVAALQYLVDLVNAGGSQPKPNGFTREQVIEMFKGGQLSMYPTGPWMNAMIKADSPDLNYGFTMFPTAPGEQPATVSVTDSMGISEACANKQEAWQFIEFMYQDKYRQKFDETEGMLPERAAVAASSWFSAPEYKPFVDALQYAKFQPQHPKFEQIQQIMTVAVQKALGGEMTPQQALDEATQKIDAL
jgi:multiple sugar transport system substrate-binding protein